MLSVGVALWVAHVALGYSLLSVVSYGAVFVLCVACVICVKNALLGGLQTPPPKILVHPSTVRAIAVTLGDAAANGIDAANALLEWRSPTASARATAYAWLATRALPLISSVTLISAWVALFLAAPLYHHWGRPLDEVIASHVFPAMATFQSRVTGLKVVVAGAFAPAQRNLTIAGTLAALTTLMYTFYNVISLASVLTFFSLAVALADVLETSLLATGSRPHTD